MVTIATRQGIEGILSIHGPEVPWGRLGSVLNWRNRTPPLPE